MAIQPVTLQAAMLQATQLAPVQRRAEVAAQTFQAIVGQQFAAETVVSFQSIEESVVNRAGEDSGNLIDFKA